MGKRLFVGGLPYSITNEQLGDLFVQHGKVESATVLTDKFSGRSKGFGFVEMASDEDAENAIKNLNNTEIEGRKIVVNEARPREERPQRSFDRGGGNFNDRNRGRRGSDRRDNRGSRSSRW